MPFGFIESRILRELAGVLTLSMLLLLPRSGRPEPGTCPPQFR